MIFVICNFALAEDVYFRDVPDGHWAEQSVYELAQKGITAGYPDGTFRGNKPITRYEVSAFLAKLAASFNLKQGKDEKLLAELRSEVSQLTYQRNKSAEETQTSFWFESRARGTTIAPRGAKLDYRLKMRLAKNFDPDSQLKITFDTDDAGFNSSTDRPIATRMIDIEGFFKMAGLDWTMKIGPGTIVHTEANGFFPSENYTIYIRPKSSIKASKKINDLDLSAEYVTRVVAASGKIGVHEVTANAAMTWNDMTLNLRPRYMFIIGQGRDILAEAGLKIKHNQALATELVVAVGDFSAGNSGMYVKLIEQMKNLGGWGTDITIRADKVGSKYRDDIINEYEFIYLNGFDRLILDGTFDLGLKLSHKLSQGLAFEWKGDYVTTGDYKYGASYPGTYSLWQAALLYDLPDNMQANAFYKAYNVPSGIAQFSQAVPTFSDVIGIGLTCNF